MARFLITYITILTFVLPVETFAQSLDMNGDDIASVLITPQTSADADVTYAPGDVRALFDQAIGDGNGNELFLADDFDGDEKDDIATICFDENDDAKVLTTPGPGDVAGTTWTQALRSGDQLTFYFLPGDYNGDGNADIAAFYPAENGQPADVKVKITYGPNGAQQTSDAEDLLLAGELNSAFVSANVDGIAGDEIVAVSITGANEYEAQAVMNDGTALPVWSFTLAAGTIQAIRAGDYTNDGVQDLILVTADASANFSAQIVAGPNGTPGASWNLGNEGFKKILSGDFNNDDVADIAAVYENASNENVARILSGPAGSQVEWNLGTGEVFDLLAGDFNNIQTQCANGVDDDGDGLVDLDDPGCENAEDNTEYDDGPDAPACDDNIDNDGDGLIDAADPGCEGPLDDDERDEFGAACDNGIDDDDDGLTDFPNDPGCSSPTDTTETNVDGPQCDNGVDDDGDGLTDSSDPGCSAPTDDDERDPSGAACDNGIDDDDDGLTDFPNDPGCSSPTDTTETNVDGPACDNGIDDDGDGLVDSDDPGCEDPTDDTETDPEGPACDNGIDDDGDGLTDLLDPGCENREDDSETDADGPACDNGEDDDGDGLTDSQDPGCSGPTDSDERDPNGPQCDNGIDDDNDGLTDFPADPDCSGPIDDTEGQLPGTPQNVQASDGAFEGFVRISWSEVSNADFFYIFRSQFEGTLGAPLAAGGVPLELTGTSHDDISAVPGVRYYYTMRAFNALGESALSNTDEGYRFIDGPLDCDGDGVSDEQEEIDGTGVCDPGSFRLHLKSPAYTKYNTFLSVDRNGDGITETPQSNFLEVLANGTVAVELTITVFDISGEVVSHPNAVQTLTLQPNEQRDFDIHSIVGRLDTYGLVKLEWDDTIPGATIIGRMANYRLDPLGDTFSFGFVKELRNPTRGVTYATGNSFDPQGAGNLVPNWLELINLSESDQTYTYNLYNQEGALLATEMITLAPFQEQDVQAGHEFGQGVYLIEVIPSNGAAQYLANVTRYSSNAPEGVVPDAYTFAFPIDAKAGNGDTQYVQISDEVSAPTSCWTQTNWLEVTNVREIPVSALVVFRDAVGATIAQQQFTYQPRSQFHFNASAMVEKGQVGSVEISATEPGSLLVQSLIYFHDCRDNKLQTGYSTPAQIAGQDVQGGSYNTFLEMENFLRVIGVSDAATSYSLDASLPEGVAGNFPIQVQVNGLSNTSLANDLNLPVNAVGTLTIRTDTPKEVVGVNVRFRENAGRADFAIPTLIQ